MATLILKFESKVLKEYPIMKASVVIGRAPGNEIVVDNLAVSGHHAKVAVEEGHFIVEDLNSLNGTFLNSQRIRKSSLKEGDLIAIGKHTLEFIEKGGISILMMGPQMDKTGEAPRADQTVVLDTKQRRDFLAKATAIAEGADADMKTQVACLVVQAGRTDQPEYILTGKISIIGKDQSASVRLKGWFAPRVAAIITRQGRRFDIAPSEKSTVTKVNSQPLTAPQELNEGDVIQIKRTQLRFHYRE